MFFFSCACFVPCDLQIICTQPWTQGYRLYIYTRTLYRAPSYRHESIISGTWLGGTLLYTFLIDKNIITLRMQHEDHLNPFILVSLNSIPPTELWFDRSVSTTPSRLSLMGRLQWTILVKIFFFGAIFSRYWIQSWILALEFIPSYLNWQPPVLVAVALAVAILVVLALAVAAVLGTF